VKYWVRYHPEGDWWRCKGDISKKIILYYEIYLFSMSRKSLPSIEDEIKRMRRTVRPKGSQPAYEIQKPTKNRRDGDIKQYFVELDSLNLISGNRIDRKTLNQIRNRYDVIMIWWRGGDLKLGKEIFYISGKGQHAVEDVAIQYSREFYKKKNCLQVNRKNKNEVRPLNICDEAKKKNLSMLYLKADIISAIDEGYL
jgi:hypothetical protein